MADDIVTRLRMPICGNYDDDHPSWGPQPCDGCVEAADEIERLRANLKEAARQFDLLVAKYKALHNGSQKV